MKNELSPVIIIILVFAIIFSRIDNRRITDICNESGHSSIIYNGRTRLCNKFT